MNSRAEAREAADVTIVVTPREQFGVVEEALAALVDNTAPIYRLIYIDGGSPEGVAAWLREQSERHGFELIRFDRFLSPNEARNIGWRRATTRHLVFIDNDVVPAPGWLETLVAAADETGADIVTPLICQGTPLHSIVHQAGGVFTKDLGGFYAAEHGRRIVQERLHLAGRPVGQVAPDRVPTQLCEFHCMLIRRDLIDRMGPLDEGMMATREHLDFCMGVHQAGGRAVFEPRSVVTYLYPRSRPIAVRDWPYFLVRWSEPWQRRSIEHFQSKWGLDPAQPCFRNLERWYRFRYDDGLIAPLVRRFLPMARRSSHIRRLGVRIARPIFRAAGARLTAATDARRSAEHRPT